jgi:uncharacterized protein YaaN involved in tellurite resistance
MSTQVREQAEEVAKLVDELNAVILPEPSADLVPLPDADAPTAEEIKQRMGEIDMGDTNSIVAFGSAAQAELQEISQSMLEGVKQQGCGPRGRQPARHRHHDPRLFRRRTRRAPQAVSWWEKLFGRAKPLARFIARFETVQGQIDKITDNLLGHEHTLMKDIKSLDKLYEKTLDFYDELALYIAAGEAKLKELDTQTSRPRRPRFRPRPRTTRSSRRRSCATCAPRATTWNAGCMT